MNIKEIFKRKPKNDQYISSQEIKDTAKYNMKMTRYFEKQKRRKNVPEEEFLSKMKDPNNILEIEDLHTYFFTDAGTVKAVDGVSFNIPKKSIVGVVGESGCGKSVTSLSIMRLLQSPQGQIYSGEIRFASDDGKCYDIAKMPTEAVNRVRGKQISMIFQEPMTSLNPVFKIGHQLDEVYFILDPEMPAYKVRQKSIDMLDLVGIANPERVYDSYPHELSGGMRQRVMISMALACNPSLIIADEPTTALDVTIQAQILDILREIKDKIEGSIMLITHDLGVIAEMADHVVVMYAGRVIEQGTAEEIFDRPMHPYTIGLQKSKPVLNKKVDRLYNIPGSVPNPINMPNYCYFRDRCSQRFGKCAGEYPELSHVGPTHKVACYLYDKIKEDYAREKAKEEK